MDNGVKALLIAAGVLIVIIIVALGIRTLGSGQDNSQSAKQLGDELNSGTQGAIGAIKNALGNNYPKEFKNFKQVEYIRSTGREYIDTGYVGKNTLRVITKFYVYTRHNWDNYFGTYGSTGHTKFFFVGNYNQGPIYTYYGKDMSSWNVTNYFPNDHMFNVDWNRNELKINGNEFVFRENTFVSDYNIIINGNTGYSNNKTASKSKINWYSFQIYDNGVLVRNFIPCYNKLDGEVGLFDLVENRFYTNEGEGAFEKGPDVN